MIVSIHQPNLFPWLGYFQKIRNADVFVYLDHALTNPRNPLWQKRVKLMINKEPNWITVPLRSSKEKPFLPLYQIEINDSARQLRKLRKTVEQNYSKAPFFDEGMELANVFFHSEKMKIADRNIDFIESVCHYLDIHTERKRSSQWMHTSLSNALLVDIVSALNGSIYLAGDGAGEYQELEPFHSKGIDLVNLQFEHPQYDQFNSDVFYKGLSILDAIMNLGQATRELIPKVPIQSYSAVNE